jgi:hypothetical protein
MARLSVSQPGIQRDIARLGETLNWHGAMFVDYFFDHQTGQRQYIECNPRIGETVNAMLSGVNLGELLMRVSLGETVDPVCTSKLGVRTHMSYMVYLASAMQGASRRELLRIRRSIRSGEGIYENSEEELSRVEDDRGSRIALQGIFLALMASPRFGEKIVNGTVENYSIPASCMKLIEKIAPAELDEYYRRRLKLLPAVEQGGEPPGPTVQSFATEE